MALRERKNPDIPGTSKQATCRKETDGKKCGKDAHNWIEGKVEVMGKQIPVKLPVCDDHLTELQERAS